jgi:hypothetical protein
MKPDAEPTLLCPSTALRNRAGERENALRKAGGPERECTVSALGGEAVDAIGSTTRRQMLRGLLLLPLGMAGAAAAQRFSFPLLLGAYAQNANAGLPILNGGLRSLTGAIQTQNGHLLTAAKGGGLGVPNLAADGVALCTGADAVGPFEEFTIVWVDQPNGIFALKTYDGHFVTAVDGGGVDGPDDERSPVHTDAEASGVWEQFTIAVLADDAHVSIQTSDLKHFLSAVKGGGVRGGGDQAIRTDATTLGPAETFKLISDSVVGVNPENFYPKGLGPVFDPKTATPDIVTKAAIDYLTANAGLWLMKDPARELRRIYAQPDWEVEFSQWSGGVLVFGAEVYVSFVQGAPYWVRSNYIPGLDSFDKTPKISAEMAMEVARKDMASIDQIPPERISTGGKAALVISAPLRNEPSRPVTLVYRMRLTTIFHYVDYTVDAKTGEVSRRQVPPLY